MCRDDCTAVHRYLASNQVDRLNAVRPLIDRSDSRVAEVLSSACLLDIAHAAVHLHSDARHFYCQIRTPGLRERGQQSGHLISTHASVVVDAVLREINGCRVPVTEATNRRGARPHVEQHPLHIRMVDDRGWRRTRGSRRPTLEPVIRKLQGLLVRALGDADSLEPDRKAGVVHHREHGPHSAALLAE